MLDTFHLGAIKTELAFKKKYLGEVSDRHDKQQVSDEILVLEDEIRRMEWEQSQAKIRNQSPGKFDSELKCGET